MEHSADDGQIVAQVAGEPRPPRLLDLVRNAIRVRHYAYRTEQSYVDWIRRFIVFHGKRHPAGLGAFEVQGFLTYLAVERGVSAATQAQARSALLFLYREVLAINLPWMDEVVQARGQRRLPVVLTQREVMALLGEMTGVAGLVAALLYGTGMRLMEGLGLRVKDVEFSRRELIVRQGKGGKDRVTVLPENLLLPLKAQLERSRVLFEADRAAGRPGVYLPDALAVKFPHAGQSWGWHWVLCCKAATTSAPCRSCWGMWMCARP